MRAFLDTSVLVAATIAAHPAHARALPWLQRARSRAVEALVAAHTLAELYAVLSSLPVRPRLSPTVARQLIRENVLKNARIVSLSGRDYELVLAEMAEKGLSGGVIYDALAVRAARKAKADRIVTLNRRDFLRVWPEGSESILEP